MGLKFERTGGFVGDTPVTVDSGRQCEIEHVFKGDRALGRVEATGADEYGRVTSRLERICETCYISFVQGDAEREFPIETALDQEFRVSKRGWVRAIDIVADDQIETRTGSHIMVESVESSRDVAVVFALDIEDVESCFVGRRELWARSGGRR